VVALSGPNCNGSRLETVVLAFDADLGTNYSAVSIYGNTQPLIHAGFSPIIVAIIPDGCVTANDGTLILTLFANEKPRCL